MNGAEDDRLRRALNESAAGDPGSADCPSDDAIWSAAHGELPAEETRRLIDHAVTCAACRISFQAVAQIEARRTPKPARATRLWWSAGALAAAVLLLAVVLPRLLPGDAPGDQVRGASELRLESLISTTEPLPRDAFVLRWSPGPPGTLYTITIAGEDLEVLHVAEQIESAEYTVPAEALAGLPAGSTVVWRVRATLPDTRSVDTAPFIAVVR